MRADVKRAMIVVLAMNGILLAIAIFQGRNIRHTPVASASDCSPSYIKSRNKVDAEYKTMVDELLTLNDPKVGRVLYPHLRNVAEELTAADRMERNECKYK